MKNGITSFVSLAIILLFLPSCTGNFRLEKRHYRNGYYLSSTKHEHVIDTDFEAGRRSDSESVFRSDESTADIALNDGTDTAVSSSLHAELIPPVDSFISTGFVIEPVVESEKSVVDKRSVVNPPDDSVPVEARGLNILWLVSLGLLVLGVIAAIVAFLPFASAGLVVLVAAAPFLILGALGVSIAVMVTARKRMLSAAGADLKNYYDKLRKRARVIVIFTSVVIGVFLIGLLAVLATLSNL